MVTSGDAAGLVMVGVAKRVLGIMYEFVKAVVAVTAKWANEPLYENCACAWCLPARPSTGLCPARVPL